MNDLEKGRRIAWAMRTFTDWRDERNKCSAIQAKCPLGLLENPDAEKLNCWVFRFIVEARHKDTQWVLRTWTLYGRSKSKLCPNLMDKNDPCFELSGTMLRNIYPRTVLVVQLSMQPLSLQTNILDFCSCTVTVSTPFFIVCVCDLDCMSFFDLWPAIWLLSLLLAHYMSSVHC